MYTDKQVNKQITEQITERTSEQIIEQITEQITERKNNMMILQDTKAMLIEVKRVLDNRQTPTNKIMIMFPIQYTGEPLSSYIGNMLDNSYTVEFARYDDRKENCICCISSSDEIVTYEDCLQNRICKFVSKILTDYETGKLMNTYRTTIKISGEYNLEYALEVFKEESNKLEAIGINMFKDLYFYNGQYELILTISK